MYSRAYKASVMIPPVLWVTAFLLVPYSMLFGYSFWSVSPSGVIVHSWNLQNYVELARNPIYVALHEAIVEWLVDQRSVSLRRAGTDRLAFESHREIFEAIAARDPAAAGDAMRRHLDEIAKRYWNVKESEA